MRMVRVDGVSSPSNEQLLDFVFSCSNQKEEGTQEQKTFRKLQFFKSSLLRHNSLPILYDRERDYLSVLYVSVIITRSKNEKVVKFAHDIC